jgi:hypothetical protein
MKEVYTLKNTFALLKKNIKPNQHSKTVIHFLLIYFTLHITALIAKVFREAALFYRKVGGSI